MGHDRINTRLSKPLAEFVARLVGEDGPYETPSEYIRDLIRRDMETREDEAQAAFEVKILQGYRDFAEGRFIESSGDFKTDMAIWKRRRAEGWK
ncbi:MAG: CopG family transcriptional regulator [Asticcacaulis sp.]